MKNLSDEVINNLINSNLPKKFLIKIMSDCQYILNSRIKDIEAIILFGSCARLEMNTNSDIDLLIVTTELIDVHIKSDITSELDMPIVGVTTDVKFYTRNQLKQSESLFINNVRKDGLILWQKKV